MMHYATQDLHGYRIVDAQVSKVSVKENGDVVLYVGDKPAARLTGFLAEQVRENENVNIVFACWERNYEGRQTS
jgi:hypothetical protein